MRPPDTNRHLCHSTVPDHDKPPTAGYLTLEHDAVRERLGLLTRPVEEERAVEESAIGRVREALEERPGFTRQWLALVQRVRDQLTLHAIPPVHREVEPAP